MSDVIKDVKARSCKRFFFKRNFRDREAERHPLPCSLPFWFDLGRVEKKLGGSLPFPLSFGNR